MTWSWFLPELLGSWLVDILSLLLDGITFLVRYYKCSEYHETTSDWEILISMDFTVAVISLPRLFLRPERYVLLSHPQTNETLDTVTDRNINA